MTESHEIPIVDAHQHFWDLTNHRYPWLDPGTPSIVGDTSKIRGDYTPENYLRDAQPLNIVGSVHLDGGFDPSDPVGETRLADRVHRATKLPSGIVGAVKLDDPDLASLLDDHIAASPLFRGVRHIVAWHEIPRLNYVESSKIMSTKIWRAGYASLAARDLSADMQLYPKQMAQAAELAGEFPSIQMIINQAGMPDGLFTGDHSDWYSGIRLLAQNPNVSVKISGFGMLKPDWSVTDIRPLVESIIEVFGPSRVMLGSNYPVDKLFKTLPAIFEAYLACLDGLDRHSIHQICALNAIRTYRLAIPSAANQ